MFPESGNLLRSMTHTRALARAHFVQSMANNKRSDTSGTIWKRDAIVNSSNVPIKELVLVVELRPLVLLDDFQMELSQIVDMLTSVCPKE